MHPRFSLNQGNTASALPRAGASFALLLLGCWGLVIMVRATPGIVGQIARPCTECYLGAFASPLEPYGYWGRRPAETSAGQTPPVTISVPAVLAGTRHAQPVTSGPWLALDDTTGAEQTPLLGASRFGQSITPRQEPADAAVTPEFQRDGETAANGGLMARDLWNTTPAAAFRLQLTSTAPAGNLLDEASRSSAAGATGADSRRMDPAASRGSPRDKPNAVEPIQDIGTSSILNAIPSGRVTLHKDLERHFLQIGTFQMNAASSSGGGETDVGTSANYQFVVNPNGAFSDTLSAHAVLIHETRPPASANRANGFNTLDTFRADVAWTIADAVSPSIQYFQTAGSVEAIRYVWPGARPNSAGVAAGITYFPRGTAESPMRFLNLRFGAQYVAYTEFNGISRGTNGNNALYLTLWGALRF